MHRRTAVITCGALLLAPGPGFAQSNNKTVRIGLLFGDAPAPHEEEELLVGLREHGLVEGRNLVIERRHAQGELHLMPGMGRELATMKLDAMISTCTPTTRVAQQVFGTTPDSMPIIMAAVADPVGQKIIASLAQPGANVTGLSSQAEDIMPKMLSLFAEVLQRPATVAVLVDSGSNVHPRMWPALQLPAQQLNLRLVQVEAGRKPGEPPLPLAFEAAMQAGAKSIFVLPDEPFFFADRASGAYISKVVEGQKPGNMPVSQPTRFELVVNLKTARSLGIAVPQTLLLSANAVIQ